MGNSLRCCLACMLPCGALDLVRIVHLSGRVDEYGRGVFAGEVLAAHPNHVLSRPCAPPSSGQQQGPRRCGRILIVSPESELERGEIYFLIPAASVPDGKRKPRASDGGGGWAPSDVDEVDRRRRGNHHVRSKSEGSAAATAAPLVSHDRVAPPSGAASPETTSQYQQQQHRRRMSTGSQHAASSSSLESTAQQHPRRMSTGSHHAAPSTSTSPESQQHRRRMSTGSHAASWQPHLARIVEDQ